MGEKVPSDVTRPIKKSHRSGLLKKPADHCTPVIDGRVTSFYEWIGAGKFDLKFDAGGAMTASGNNLSMLYFCFDTKKLYLRIDGALDSFAGMDYSLEAEITTDQTRSFVFDLSNDSDSSCTRNIFEASINLSELGGEKPETADIIFRLKKENTVVEVAPLYNSVQIDFLTHFETDWIV